MNDPEAGPILVTGADRTGTSLLYALLASHSQVDMTRRANFWRWFEGRFGDLGVDSNLDRCLDALVRYKRLAVLEPDPVRLRSAFREGPRTYGRLFALVHSQHAEAVGKSRWGDKSLHLELNVGRVFEEWPNARIVQMIRDPRDRHASVIKRAADKDGDRSQRLASVTGRWISSVVAGGRNEARYPERYRLLRYESLVADPDTVTKEVCHFFGLDFEPEMMSMGAVEEQHQRGGNSSFGVANPGGISSRSVGRFRETLDPVTVAFIESACRELMERFDYQPVADLSRRDRWRYRLGLPANVLRLEGWMLAARLEGLIGERVPKRRFD